MPDPSSMQEPMTVVERFAADYFVVEGLTPGRRADVLVALRALEAFGGRPPEELDDLVLRDFVAAEVASGLHVNTVRKHLHAIQPFYRWAGRRRILDADHYLRIKEVRPPRGATAQARPRPYKPEEIRVFWEQLDARWPRTTDRKILRYTHGTTAYRRIWRHAMGLQTQAVASLALFGGLRSHEIRAAGLADIHPDNAYIVVRNAKSSYGEANGYREVPYTDHGRELVAEWVTLRDTILRPPHDKPWLVLSAYANPNGRVPSHPLNPISDDGWENLLSKVGPWELHRFRHTCATEWLRAGVKLERVSRLLGHSNIQQTLCYTELVAEDVKRDVIAAEDSFVKRVGRRMRELGIEKPTGEGS
jgi:integrase